MKKVFGILLFGLGLSAVSANDVWAKNWNTASDSVEKISSEHVGNVVIKFPKYFFSDNLNPICKMKGKHENKSFQQAGTLINLDLRDKDNFQWMVNLKNYRWP